MCKVCTFKILREQNSLFAPTSTEDKTLKNKNLLQAIKFTVFSLSAGAIQLGVNAIMYEVLHIDYWVSYLTALVLSVLWNFTFNRKFTFKSASNVPFAMFLVVCFYGVFTPLSTWWGHAMEGAGIPGLVVTVFSMLVNFVSEFFYQKYVVFKDSLKELDENEKAFQIIMKVLKEKF